MIEIIDYLYVSGLLFAIGLLGVILRRDALVMLMSIELMLNSANLAAAAYAVQMGGVEGQLLVLLAITAAAAETAVGLVVMVSYYRHKQTVDVEEMTSLGEQA